MVRGFGGYLHQLDAGSDFWHYGVDVQEFVHLSLAPKMFVFRLWGEGVTGSIDEVPFYELPYLGGDFLRGYDFARFRDRLLGRRQRRVRVGSSGSPTHPCSPRPAACGTRGTRSRSTACARTSASV